jgi:PIN domain nuclease of toxin-antitoxin system
VRLLLDTNVFILAVNEPKKLTVAARRALSDPRNERVLSHASIWEIVTKSQKGKLDIITSRQEIERQCVLLKIDLQLPIELEHIYHLRSLPPFHSDPFDRLLVAQAQVEGLRMVSSDSIIADHYLPDVIW